MGGRREPKSNLHEICPSCHWTAPLATGVCRSSVQFLERFTLLQFQHGLVCWRPKSAVAVVRADEQAECPYVTRGAAAVGANSRYRMGYQQLGQLGDRR